MNLIFWTVVSSAVTVIALFYIIRLVIRRKSHLDFSNHLFVAICCFIIGAIVTGIQLFDLSMKWTSNAPIIEGACTINLSSKSISIYFEDADLSLSTSMWSNTDSYGKYGSCKATYYPISKEVIKIQYENQLDE